MSDVSSVQIVFIVVVEAECDRIHGIDGHQIALRDLFHFLQGFLAGGIVAVADDDDDAPRLIWLALHGFAAGARHIDGIEQSGRRRQASSLLIF